MTVTMDATDNIGALVSRRVDTLTTPSLHLYFQREEVQKWLVGQLMNAYLVTISVSKDL